jgi:hypothetical protein
MHWLTFTTDFQFRAAKFDPSKKRSFVHSRNKNLLRRSERKQRQPHEHATEQQQKTFNVRGFLLE